MLQQWLIHFILNPLAKFAQRFSGKMRDRMFTLAGVAVFVVFFLYSASVIRWRYLYTFAISCFLLGVMILCSLEKEIKPVKFRLRLLLPLLGVGALTLLSTVLNNVEYLFEALLMTVAYPVVYICWNNADREKLIRLLIRIIRISLVIFVVASLLVIQITTRRYSGLFRNPNNCAFYLSMVCACLGAEILYRRSFDKNCIADILLFAVAQAMIHYTNSRSGQLAVYALAAGGIVVYMLTHSKKENLGCLLRAGCCVLASAVFMSVLIYAFQARQLAPIPYYAKTTRTFYFTERWEHLAGNQQNFVGELPPEESQQEDFFGTESYDDFNDGKSNMEGKDLDRYSSGRLSIWKQYGSELNLLGHEEVPTIIILNGDGMETEIHSTHMTIMEVAYECGIPAGVLFLILNIMSGILAIVYAWKNSAEKYALFPLMVILAFGVCSVFTAINGSFAYISTLYYYLAMFPLMVKTQEETAVQRA